MKWVLHYSGGHWRRQYQERGSWGRTQRVGGWWKQMSVDEPTYTAQTFAIVNPCEVWWEWNSSASRAIWKLCLWLQFSCLMTSCLNNVLYVYHYLYLAIIRLQLKLYRKYWNRSRCLAAHSSPTSWLVNFVAMRGARRPGTVINFCVLSYIALTIIFNNHCNDAHVRSNVSGVEMGLSQKSGVHATHGLFSVTHERNR